MRRGEYKVPGGKLVVAEVEVEDGVLARVNISGDFFLEPDDALDRIDEALRGLPAETSGRELAERIEAATIDAALIGFDARSVGIAVRRALGASTTWSDHSFELIQAGPLPAYQNLALDQVLVEELGAGRRGPMLRLWEWAESAVVLGSFQSVRNEVDLAAAERRGVRPVRRISGGGAMFVEPGTSITYSLYVPATLVDGMSFEQSYAFLDDWVLGALESIGVSATYVPLNDITSPAGKIGGAAQKRLAGGAVLHHVMMSYDMDADAMTDVLRIGREKLSDKGTTSANKRVDPLRSQSQMAREDVVTALLDYFRSRYTTSQSEVRSAEFARVEELVESKFATKEWLHRVP
ncbi:lipoyl protein ligase domain-containing protein [Pseudactinotalea sp. Z1739]|uniref:lipoyl protein ligase domain-containing protein n=1 Tax=Pseudactinotalea sp. Z1739 TaxID=3413028 RepID=UPI003C7C8E15